MIAGGGIAALETLLALRATPRGAALDITLIAPGPHLVYRPLAVLEPFGAAPRRYRLAAICAEHGARLVADALAAVDGDARVARTAGGAAIPYDALVIAVGARPRPALPLARTLAAAEGVAAVAEIVRDLDAGRAGSVAFVAPPGAGWSLPLYELALLTARHVARRGRGDVALALVTAEDVPLATFAGAGSAAVARLLGEAGVETVTGAAVAGGDRGRLQLATGRAVAAELVVALPRLAGPALAGVPTDADGFVQADPYQRVPGLPDVYAVGDATTFPVKQGGLASQQADLVASLIARTAGPDPSTRPRLRAILLTGAEPLYLQATLADGRPVASSASRQCPWWPPHKVAARWLAPYLADREPLAAASGGALG